MKQARIDKYTTYTVELETISESANRKRIIEDTKEYLSSIGRKVINVIERDQIDSWFKEITFITKQL